MKIGIIGAGQLGRMLALAGYPLGLEFVFLDKTADAPGGQVGDIIVGEFDDPDKLAELADCVDIVTFDVENVSASVVATITGRTRFLPPLAALEVAQDRLSEKRLFAELRIPTPDYRAIDTPEDLASAADELGFPCVLKIRRLGYDGRGQVILRTPDDLGAAWETFRGVPLILEVFVHFDREVSIVAVRSIAGETAFYPLVENVHENGILVRTMAPLQDVSLTGLARDHAKRLFDRFEYAGVLTIEFFVRNGELLANEMAPRVHNSGHWTIEGAVTSQFENHVRAILGYPLGDASAVGHCAMVNFIGTMPPLTPVLQIAGAHYHDYGKTPRPKRKLGHCTLHRSTPEKRDAALAALIEAIGQENVSKVTETG
ncbi:MAG: 5-(carboxyamino)imidazole ribonucleotide synthase [Gammaproteobacteria bacterium]